MLDGLFGVPQVSNALKDANRKTSLSKSFPRTNTSKEYLPKELVFNINYLGADQASFTLNFSKGAAQVIGQYYQLIRLGKHGYRSIMTNLTRTADYLSDSLEQLGFIIMSKKNGTGLPLVAFRFDPKSEKHYDEFALAHQLRGRSWVVPAYTMAPHTEDLKMLRVVVREDFSKSRCDQLLGDIKLCMEMLDKMVRGISPSSFARFKKSRAMGVGGLGR